MPVEWKYIDEKKYGNSYEISTTGQIKSHNRKKPLILKQTLRNGYNSVSLSIGGKPKTLNVHQLVAITFLGKPKKNKRKKIVNHIDGNKLNNKLKNLEWITYKKNTQHALDNKLFKVHSRAVLQYDLKGNFIKRFKSIILAAEKTGANDRHISCVCKGKRKTTGGFVWKYEDEDFDVTKMDKKVEKKVIKKYPNYYVFADGKIYSKSAKKYLKLKKLPSGYLTIKLCNNGEMKDYYIQQLVAQAFIGKVEGKKTVNHIDGDKSNNNVDNLEWCDASENAIHYNKYLKNKKDD